jgi:hypothetical protein
VELLARHLQQAAVPWLQFFRVMLGDSHHPRRCLMDKAGTASSWTVPPYNPTPWDELRPRPPWRLS